MTMTCTDETLDAINALYEQSINPAVTYEALATEVADITTSLSRDTVVDLAARFGVHERTKRGAVAAITCKMHDRKQNWQRTRF